jgi:hypothetical protein
MTVIGALTSHSRSDLEGADAYVDDLRRVVAVAARLVG